MAKAKKLPSGKWNCKAYDYTDNNNKRHYKSFTAETKKEAEYLAAEFLIKKEIRSSSPTQLTVGEVIDAYLKDSKSLSPTTRHAYDRIKEYAFASIIGKKINLLKDADMQAAIDLEAKRKTERTGKDISPKTVKNEWGLVSAAIKSVCGISYNVKLPKIQKTIEILPEPERVITAIKGSNVELPCLLAMWMSLRMSEIKGLMCSSIRDQYLIINQVMVTVGTDEIIKQDAKTESSKRILHIPDYIMELIRATEPYKDYISTGSDAVLIPLTRNQIYDRFTKIMNKAGINMSFHNLRHMFASISLNVLNLPPKTVQTSGGWATNLIMERVYSQSFSTAQKNADMCRDLYFEKIMQHEMQHKD